MGCSLRACDLQNKNPANGVRHKGRVSCGHLRVLFTLRPAAWPGAAGYRPPPSWAPRRGTQACSSAGCKPESGVQQSGCPPELMVHSHTILLYTQGAGGAVWGLFMKGPIPLPPAGPGTSLLWPPPPGCHRPAEFPVKGPRVTHLVLCSTVPSHPNFQSIE